MSAGQTVKIVDTSIHESIVTGFDRSCLDVLPDEYDVSTSTVGDDCEGEAQLWNRSRVESTRPGSVPAQVCVVSAVWPRCLRPLTYLQSQELSLYFTTSRVTQSSPLHFFQHGRSSQPVTIRQQSERHSQEDRPSAKSVPVIQHLWHCPGCSRSQDESDAGTSTHRIQRYCLCESGHERM